MYASHSTKNHRLSKDPKNDGRKLGSHERY